MCGTAVLCGFSHSVFSTRATNDCCLQVSTTNVNRVSPLWIACQDGHLPVVKYCAALAPKLLEQPKASGATPFCIACHQGHLDLVEFLADQGVDMEAMQRPSGWLMQSDHTTTSSDRPSASPSERSSASDLDLGL